MSGARTCVCVWCVCVYVVVCTVQGNYDAYIRVRAELEENQMKKYQWEQDQMKHMKVSPWGSKREGGHKGPQKAAVLQWCCPCRIAMSNKLCCVSSQ